MLRILGGAEPLPLDQVGFSDRDLDALKAMIARSYGLILVCGPTGSGKTSTLHSVLREINKPDIKIWTAEDLVRSRASVPQLLSAAQESGMLSLRQNAIEKVLRGLLDLASARAVSS